MILTRLSEVDIKNEVGNRVRLVALVKGAEVRPMKTGAESLLFTMVDKDVERECRGFEVTNALKQRMSDTVGKLYDIEADVKLYDKGADGVSCILYDIREHKGTMNPDDFKNVVPNLEGYISGISGYLTMISDTIYGQIAAYVLNKYWQKFIRFPAARSVHQNLIGGLVMHTYCVATSCVNNYNTYATVYGPDFANYSLLIAAALIHDIGKCNEYDMDDFGTTSYSTHACISSHIMDGIVEVTLAAEQLGYTGTPEFEELKHCVASHHGKLEWGSPIKPATAEAVILHMADMIDSEMWQYAKNNEKLETGSSKTEWVGGETKNYYKGLTRDMATNNFILRNADIGDEVDEV